MTHEILISRRQETLRVAQIEEGRLTALVAGAFSDATKDDDDLVGRIYLGRVERVLPNLQAAFVDIGLARGGFLGAREARVLVPDADRNTPIEACVQNGDVVLVQITRPPQGEKGAQLTADITLAGRAMVLAPCRPQIAISRSIEDETARTRLKALVEKAPTKISGPEGEAGWVVRTAAQDMDEAALTADMAWLGERWQNLLEEAEANEPPHLLFSDVGILERALRDFTRTDTRAIVIDDKAVLARAKTYCETYFAGALTRLQEADADESLFDRYDSEAQITAALVPRFNLPSGGLLVFETTEAMTTIDVNAASHNAPPIATNLEAARAIAQQIALRRLGGLLAIDFIDMESDAERAQLENELIDAFANDRQVRLGVLSEFCVMELTRKREAQTLQQMLGEQSFTDSDEPDEST